MRGGGGVHSRLSLGKAAGPKGQSRNKDKGYGHFLCSVPQIHPSLFPKAASLEGKCPGEAVSIFMFTD